MKSKIKWVSQILLVMPILTVVTVFTNCGGSGKRSTVPEKLIFGITPTVDAERDFRRIDVITEYFSKTLGVEVSHVLVSNPSAMIEAMRAKKIHVGSGGPFTYLIAADKAGAEAIVTTVGADNTQDHYQSLLITKPESPVNQIEDLKIHAKNMTLSWAYPTSASGHLVPRYELYQHGIMPEDFKEVLVSTDHTAAIFTVISGKVDIAAVFMSGIHSLIKNKRIKEQDIKIIWQSGPLLPSPVFVRKDLDDDLKIKIQRAYLDMKENDPKTWDVLMGQYLFEVKYVPVSDKDYQIYRDMANSIEGFGISYE